LGSQNVVFLGRLVERKGCEYLLRAIAYMHDNRTWQPGAKVLICGAGPLETQLQEYSRRRHIAPFVEFVGYISEADKPRYLAGADVAVYPSTGGESFGIVLLEAMAASRGAVLAGNNPGYASVMAPRPKSLFDPHDTRALADAISDLLTDTATRAAAHEWQRSYIKQFDIPTIGERTVAIYQQALHNRRG
jgi:phosphatidylinositol alpha-mannosyltransferase